eukprot:8380684-Ditylum_brightwellii.AAC.1
MPSPSSSNPSVSNAEPRRVRESMLELMEDAGVVYEEDRYNGVYEDDDKSDAGSIPSVPSSSNLSAYFHDEMPPGHATKRGEVSPESTVPVSSPSVLQLDNHAKDANNDFSLDGFSTVLDGAVDGLRA